MYLPRSSQEHQGPILARPRLGIELCNASAPLGVERRRSMRLGTPGFIPERLIEVREARAISTQIGLSNLVGKPQASISRWETGEATPEHDALDVLADHLNVRR